MTQRAPTATNLNPHAPEYTPIPPGVRPSPHAPPPLFRPPPPSGYIPIPSGVSPSPHAPPPLFRPPPPSTNVVLPNHFITYIPSNSHYPSSYPTYYATPQNPPPPPLPPPPPPPTAAPELWRGRGSRRGSWKTCNSNSKRTRSERINLPFKRDEEKTTVMIKNIPFHCLRKELMTRLDKFCARENKKAMNEGTSSKEAQETLIGYDFLYLPIDFSSKRSRGFAFVNFTNPRSTWKFYEEFHLKNWDSKKRKKLEIAGAKIQGKEHLVVYFSESLFECESDEYLPVVFTPARDGSGQAVELTVVGKRQPPARGGNHNV